MFFLISYMALVAIYTGTTFKIFSHFISFVKKTRIIALCVEVFFLTVLWFFTPASLADTAPEEVTNATNQILPAAPTNTANVVPEGASHYQAPQESGTVSIKSERIKRSTQKPLSQGKYTSATPAQTVSPDDWRKLSYVSGSFTPESGIDPRILTDLSKRTASGMEEHYLYGFLLMDEYLSQQTGQELENLGITILGPHSDAYKVKLPADLAKLKAIVALPYVEWIGYAQPDQKLDPDLQQQSSANPDGTLNMIVNLFDNETPDQTFKHQLEAAGAKIGTYDSDLRSYQAEASQDVVDKLIKLNFVLFIEPMRKETLNHDQSMPMIGADYIRPGASGSTYDADSIPVGIIDSGFMMGAGGHQDLNKNGCGLDFTDEASGVWNDAAGHGTHVLGTISGTGTVDSRYRGVATGVGSSSSTRIRAAKVFESDGGGVMAWTENAMDWMGDLTSCSGSSPRPMVINYSGGHAGTNQVGTDSTSRKLDSKVWNYKQVYVISAGNEGPNSGTIGSPGVAKNALTVGNVFDHGSGTIGDITGSSSRGPTGDARMKPNIVAPGNMVTSTKARTTDQYTDKSGTSMAAPHVTGLVATLMDHYSWLQWNPARVRAYIMASSILHDDDTTPSVNDYGLGRVSSYLAHWARSNSNGWGITSGTGTVTDSSYTYSDVTVPSGADRLVVVMTWDEDAASAGASKAVVYDLDLYIDRGVDCTDSRGRCGEYSSLKVGDNVEYIIIDSPPAGTYRVKAVPWNAPSSGVRAGIASMVIQGDPTPTMGLAVTPSTATPLLNNTFTVTTTVNNPSYIASGVDLALTNIPGSLTLLNVETTRKDGITMSFGANTDLTLGDIIESDTRSVKWTFRATSVGSKTIPFRALSENGGTHFQNAAVTVTSPDLIVQNPGVSNTTLTAGQSFIASATVKNQGNAASTTSTLRYYRSTNSTISVSDTQIATNAITSLTPNSTSAQNATVTAPTTKGTYWIGACVDFISSEANTGNNCSSGVEVTVNELVLNKPIDNIIINRDSAPSTVDISNIFRQVNGMPITVSVLANSNPTLVSTKLAGNNLTLTYATGWYGTANITLRATANGESVDYTFNVTVNSYSNAEIGGLVPIIYELLLSQ